MALTGLTLADIRKRALGYLNSSDEDNHWQTLVNDWINDALQEMVTLGEGVETVVKFKTEVGKRDYPLPQELLRPKMVLWKGYQCQYVPVVTQDFMTEGTTQIDRYSLFYAPERRIILGPRPPAEVAEVQVYMTSEPRLLEDDDQEPDIPNRFRHHLATYAAAQAFLADGNNQEHELAMRRFEKSKQEYREWVLYNSRQNFRSVRVEVPY